MKESEKEIQKQNCRYRQRVDSGKAISEATKSRKICKSKHRKSRKQKTWERFAEVQTLGTLQRSRSAEGFHGVTNYWGCAAAVQHSGEGGIWRRGGSGRSGGVRLCSHAGVTQS